jgi:hypothetical protein
VHACCCLRKPAFLPKRPQQKKSRRLLPRQTYRRAVKIHSSTRPHLVLAPEPMVNSAFWAATCRLASPTGLRLHGGITGSLPGDQPSGNFSTSNYAFMWMFTGGLMFTGGYYKNIARPYSMLDLTYQYDARAKAGGLNGGVRFGVDLYMTQDWAVYIEAGVNLAMMREALAPYNVGGVVGVGVRTFF